MEFLSHLEDDALIEKGARHFIDALQERKRRNDIDYHGRGLYFICFFIQSNWVFLNLMTVSTWLYIFLVFFEPAQLHDVNSIDFDLFQTTKVVELVVLCIFACNFILEATLLISTYRYSSAIIHKNKGWFKRVMTILFKENPIHMLGLAVDLVFFIDYPIYVLGFPYGMFRFSRLLRPGNTFLLVKMMLHSVKMRKTIRGFVNIIPKVVFRQKDVRHYVIFCTCCHNLWRYWHPVHLRRVH
jgi:hypothetical protein